MTGRDYQVKKATMEALDEFWDSISKSFPHVPTGDFPPNLSAIMYLEAILAVGIWLDINEVNNA